MRRRRPTVVDPVLKALSGVGAAANVSNRIEIAASAPDTDAGLAQINAIRTLVCDVNAGAVRRLDVIESPDRTRIQPSIAFEARSNRFVMAWREQNFNTSVNTAYHPGSAGSWSPLVRPGQQTHTAPTLAASAENGELVLWYAFE